MHAPLGSGKFSLENEGRVPCMMGDTDVALISQILSALPEAACLLELGPWLGGISQRLAQHGTLHVVDRFIWSDLNAENHPDILKPGQSFRPLFEEIINGQAIIHQIEMEDFTWDGTPLDFCLIDMPRNGADLWHCLQSILTSLRPNGYLLVKHGLNPSHYEMSALLGALVAQGSLSQVDTQQPQWCNIAVFQAGPKSSTALKDQTWSDVIHQAPAQPTHDLSAEALTLRAARMGFLAAQGNTALAFALLRQQAPTTKMLSAWDQLEPLLSIDKAHQGAFAGFAEILHYHHSALSKSTAAPAQQSLSWALRHSWLAHLDQKNTTDFDINAIARAFAEGAFNEE